MAETRERLEDVLYEALNEMAFNYRNAADLAAARERVMAAIDTYAASRAEAQVQELREALTRAEGALRAVLRGAVPLIAGTRDGGTHAIPSRLLREARTALGSGARSHEAGKPERPAGASSERNAQSPLPGELGTVD